MSRTRIIAIAEYPQIILDTATKPSYFFQISSFYHETNTMLKEYKEKGCILRWKPLLNLNKK